MKKRLLYFYVIGVIIALIIVNYLAYLTGGTDKLHTSILVSLGFLLGMLAMYIAIHMYRWK